jgi:hypothetical protein
MSLFLTGDIVSYGPQADTHDCKYITSRGRSSSRKHDRSDPRGTQMLVHSGLIDFIAVRSEY